MTALVQNVGISYQMCMTEAIMQRNNSFQALEWRVFDGQMPYPDVVAEMEAYVAKVAEGKASGAIWCLEHTPCYTAGTSAKAQDLLDARFPVYETGRGGEYTYHGPGQLVVYPIVDLKRLMHGEPDLRQYIRMLEQWVIDVLAVYGIAGERRDGRVGIWVRQGASEAKIAAIGVRVRKWVAFHGLAINVAPNLGDFGGIVPCGIREYGVTSMAALLGDAAPSLADVRKTLRETAPRA